MRASAAFLALLGALALGVGPATAQVQGKKSEIHVYVGELFGDDLTDRSVSGEQPELDDDITFGVRYGYNFTRNWGIEASLGFSPSSAVELPGGDVDVDVTFLDVDAVWHFTPESRLAGYLVFGVGYASADLDEPIRGVVGGRSVKIDDDSSFTLNGGVGVKYFATKNFILRGEARYHFIGSLVDQFDDSLNTFETTGGVGWVF